MKSLLPFHAPGNLNTSPTAPVDPPAEKLKSGKKFTVGHTLKFDIWLPTFNGEFGKGNHIYFLI